MKLSFFQIVVLSTFGALAVAGVMVFAFFVSTNSTATIGEVEVWGTLDEGAFGTVLQQLAEEDGRLRAVSYVQKDEASYARELADALASGTGPELFIMTQDAAERDGGKVYPIPYESFSREQFQNSFVESANPFMGVDGVRAIPFLVDPLVLYWNRDMLATAGFAKPPAYWDEFYDLSSKVTKRDQANTVERSAVAFGEYRNVDHAKDIVSLLILQAGGKVTARDAGGQLRPMLVSRGSEVTQPSESALRFYTEFANPARNFYSWNRAQRESRAAFGAGTLALYIGLASEEPLLRSINPNLNFAIAAIPQIRSKDNFINVGTVYAFAIPRTGSNPQGALTVAYLLASARSSTFLSQAIGMPSARRDVLSTVVGCFECLQDSTSCTSVEQQDQCVATFQATPVTGTDYLFNKQAIITRAWTDPNPEGTDTVFRDMIESITSGSARLTEAIQRAEAALGVVIGGQ
jgi:ABC-type glycerol-3-phosphate transport system substrate-binding protein